MLMWFARASVRVVRVRQYTILCVERMEILIQTSVKPNVRKYNIHLSLIFFFINV